MSDCGCHAGAPATTEERRSLWWALALNAAMAGVGGVGGWVAESTGLLADALDMLSDASAYAIALLAIGRSAVFKARAAGWSGAALLLLGAGMLLEVGRRAVQGSEPVSGAMVAIALLSLAVNVTVLRLLRRFREGEVHLRAAWIFTRADVVANLGVIAAALLVLATRSPIPDLVVGAAIGLYVIREALEIVRQARAARRGA